MTTKEEVQAWAREEWVRLDQEKTESVQAACDHARSGTRKSGTWIVACDDCKKELTMDDATRSGPAPEDNGLDLQSIAIGRAR